MGYSRILVPTDGSVINEPAETRAFELASESGASLLAVHALEQTALPLGEHRAAMTETLEREAKEFVESVVTRAQAAGVSDVDGAVLGGRPYDAIVQAATSEGCDLIVMGTHGRSKHQPYVLGSVTARVLQHSPIEVLVVPTHGEAE